MAIPSDLQATMDAAEQAAASNDFALAARHLRDVAALQERTFGAAHPDLANTLNNLGVVCERIGELEESERSFRRAYAIAMSVLPADHPFVATSRANLEEFCRLHSRPFVEPDTPAQQPDPLAEFAGPEDPADTVAAEQHPVYERKHQERVAPPVAPTRGIPVGVIAVAAAAVLMVIGWMIWPSGTASTPPRADTHEATPPPSAPAPASTPESPAPAPAPATSPAEEPKPASPQIPATTPPTSSDSPTVVDARVCRSLTTSGGWECDRVTGETGAGPIYFFTRVAATRDTTIQHRWYFGDRLHQSVMLKIQANGAGYRTYSRTTIGPDRAGDWRVELRTEDGRVLTEQRFTVR
jgi:DUF2914 family protein/tetratricopeptide repeat protein